MFRYKLRTLLIVLALGPPVLALAWWGYSALGRSDVPDYRSLRSLQELNNRDWPKELRIP